MTKHCEIFAHTADVGLAASADTQAELYEALAEGLADLVCPRSAVRPARTFEMTVESEDVEVLAVDFLGGLLTMIQCERVVIHDVSVRCEGPTRLHAVLNGEPIDLARHELGEEIKAVTYHMLEVTCKDGRWAGQVLLDL